jgi:hypothetical protein
MMLELKLNNYSKDARVHVFATQFMANEPSSLGDTLTKATEQYKNPNVF